MSLSKINVAGYRAYEDEATLEIRPITLVYGFNSAGKSTLLRLLPMLHASTQTPGLNQPFATGLASAKSGSADAYFCKHRADRVISLRIRFSPDSAVSEIAYDIRQFNADTVIVEKFQVSTHNSTYIAEVDLGSIPTTGQASPLYRDVGSNATLLGLHFEGLHPILVLAPDNEISEQWQECVFLCEDALSTLQNVRWLGPLRADIPRVEARGSTSSKIDHRGGGVTQVLSRDARESRQLLERVSKWFEQNCGQRLELVPGAYVFGDLVSLAFSPLSAPTIRIPVEDTGEGMAQVIPVLTLAAQAAEGEFGSQPIIVLEHPDLHLHTNVHGSLLDYMVESAAAESQPRFVVETHSEASLTAIQLAILDQRISADDVVIHFIRNDENGKSTVNTVHFDEKATPFSNDVLNMDWFGRTHEKMADLARKKFNF